MWFLLLFTLQVLYDVDVRIGFRFGLDIENQYINSIQHGFYDPSTNW